jgi:hypothetical protein
MRRQIEHAVAEQLVLLDRGESSAVAFRSALGRLADTSGEARWLIGLTLARLRQMGGLSEQAEGLIQLFLTTAILGETADPQRNLTRAKAHDLPASGAVEIGRVLRERYVILEKLGTGVKGTVFRALDRYRTSLAGVERQVALKVMHLGGEDPVRTLQDLALGLHEGQALSHRSVLKVFELDRDGDVIFFTMELLEGQLLSRLLEQMSPARMHPLQAWQIIRQLGAGLQHAHERGVVHGDLTPRNILVTHTGELRILDFGTARLKSGVQSNSGQADIALPPGTSAYASCERLEGRTADPRDDLYALSCIAHELLTGTHPFAHRPAILARNFGVKAVRPAGLNWSQWKALRTGLAWHRAGRSMSVHTWMRKLTRGTSEQPAVTPLHELTLSRVARPFSRSRGVIAGLTLASLIGLGFAVVVLGDLSQTSNSNVLRAAPGFVRTHPAGPVPSSPMADPAGSPIGAAAAVSDDTTQKVASARPTRPSALQVSVDGYQVSPGDRFVEIRVSRNELRNNASFAWWTEPATAREGVDYVHQAKAIQTFPAGRRFTRFYVKLLPETGRAQRDFFYVAIAQIGHEHVPTKTTRAQIWLPSPREQLQARR